MTPAQELGLHLKSLREKRAMTQWEVAQRLGYTTAQFVSNWERAVSVPASSRLPDLAKVLDVPAKDLIDRIFACREAELALERKAALAAARHWA